MNGAKLLFLLLLSSLSLCSMDKFKNRNPSTDPESMIFSAEEALDKGDYSEAARLIARFRLRVWLDAACCKDASASAAMDAFTVRSWVNPKYSEISQHVSDTDHLTIVDQEVGQAEQMLANNMAPCPNWIARYGMNQFLPQKQTWTDWFLGRNPLFVSNDECRAKQQAFLQEYRKHRKQVLEAPVQDAENKQ